MLSTGALARASPAPRPRLARASPAPRPISPDLAPRSSEIFQSDTSAKDASRVTAVRKALSDTGRRYHFSMLHLSNMDSQASTYGKHDSWNQHNADESWEHFVPLDPVGTAWRKNSYKKAIAEAGDHVDALIDDFGDEETLFIIAGDHGHVAPGGMGGASDENLLVPLFAYKKGSRLGHDLKKQRRAAGSSPQLDGARFVSRARRIEEIEEKPAVVANDVCDIMAESVGSEHINTCDEWREDGEFTIETVDLAPTVMALLGLPVPRHATGVFIDDLMGSIAPSTPMSTTLGGNCTGEHLAAETRAGARLRLDRMCDGAYAANEDPATAASAAGWSADTYLKWRHTLHYRDLYQQKLAFVRGYLKAQGKLDYWDGTDLPFLAPTATPNQYYDEGFQGRCKAYDPFNKLQDAVDSGAAHRYTIQALEFGRCA